MLRAGAAVVDEILHAGAAAGQGKGGQPPAPRQGGKGASAAPDGTDASLQKRMNDLAEGTKHELEELSAEVGDLDQPDNYGSIGIYLLQLVYNGFMAIEPQRSELKYLLLVIAWFFGVYLVSFVISTWGDLTSLTANGLYVVYHDCIRKPEDVEGRSCQRPKTILVPVGKDLIDKAKFDAILVGTLVIPIGLYGWKKTYH